MFQVAARTLLQLGAELISSDAIAFYELIKNGFDAESSRVIVAFEINLEPAIWDECRILLDEAGASDDDLPSSEVAGIREALLAIIGERHIETTAALQALRTAETLPALRAIFAQANAITITDFGAGMSREMLQQVYLTVGTRFRRDERMHTTKRGDTARLTLGDKGVGRLSVMRLGTQLAVRTARVGDARWNILRIDWDQLSHDSDALVEDIRVELGIGTEKEDATASGTELRVWGLRRAWSLSDVQDLARLELSRFTDPFSGRRPVRITVRYNEESVPIPRLDQLLIEAAHAHMTARFEATHPEGPRLSGTIDYRLHSVKTTFALAAPDLASITSASTATLRSLGNFDLELYWFNRGLLRAIDGIGNTKFVRELLDRWGGGVAIYRDGFRVNPYGGKDDDWLDLDKDAFRSSAYKLNRNQLLAKIDISATGNPYLADQTNREGLQRNIQYEALHALVKHALEGRLRTFLESVDQQRRLAKLDPLEVLEERTASARTKVRHSLAALERTVPGAIAETQIVEEVNALLEEIARVFKQTRERAAADRDERERLVLLAANGLIVELIAHELHRATAHTLTMVTDATRNPQLATARPFFETLRNQLKTLRTRLSILDDVSVSGRQVKTEFDLVGAVRDILDNHQPQFERFGILAKLSVRPEVGPLRVKMVRGMVVQILENLLANSVYWLNISRREVPGFRSTLTVTIDREARTLAVTDSGPGIEPARAEEVFLPYVTTKPPGEGRGLGLYIAQEVAKYNGCTLHLSPEPVVHPGRLNTFVLHLGRAAV